MKLLAVAIAALVLLPLAAQTQSEFGIEGFGVVSTPHTEIHASISPDGQQIVWGSTDRPGGAGGWDLWQATRFEGRWSDPRPLALNSIANDFDPIISVDGRWLYFFSNREGGLGGDDLYRAARQQDGTFGAVETLGPGVNSRGNEWAPTPSADGQQLLFASDGFGGAGRHDLLVAHWNGKVFVDPRPVPGINTGNDEFDAAWLDDGKAIVFARSTNVESQPIQLYVAQCDGKAYVDAQPLPLSFNSTDSATLGPVLDASKPTEMLVSGRAPTLQAGKLDIYRIRAPRVTGSADCLVEKVSK
ncbi:MAG: TolB-like protein [Pseudomonadota bacterium]|nr:TolB-like protein [Pseudomonadota bacterium]